MNNQKFRGVKMNYSRKYACPCCGYYTLEEYRGYEICEICYWEDDPLQAENHHLYGANNISLEQARENYRSFGASAREFILLSPLLN